MSGQSLKRTLLRSASTLARRLAIGRVPKLFDAAYYLRQNSDVRKSGFDPYLHYVLRGASENRDPAEDFDTEFFRRQTGATRLDPVRYYLRVGVEAGFDPNPNFSTSSYLNRYPDVAALKINPLLHYRTDGRREGRKPEASVAKETVIPALRSVLSRHLRSLPTTEAQPFAIALLRALDGGRQFESVPRFCVLLKLTNPEIALLANALSTMCAGGHAAIRLEVHPDRQPDAAGIAAEQPTGSNARPRSDTLLIAFERCHVATTDGIIQVRYAELRLWDLRPQKARVMEIYPAGLAEIQT